MSGRVRFAPPLVPLLLAACAPGGPADAPLDAGVPPPPAARSGTLAWLDGPEPLLAVATAPAPEVVLVDPATLAVVGRLPTPGPARQVAAERGGAAVYVPHREEDAVLRMPVDGSPGESLPACDDPAGVLAAPGGASVLVACAGDGRVLSLDPSGAEAAAVDVGGAPTGLALSPGGDRLVVTHRGTGQVDLVGLPEWTRLASFQLAELDGARGSTPRGRPFGLGAASVSPDGTRALVPHVLLAADGPITFDRTLFPAISEVDLVAGTEDASARWTLGGRLDARDDLSAAIVPCDPADLAFIEGGAGAVVVFAGSDDAWLLDLRGGDVRGLVRPLPGRGPSAVLAAPDGGSLFVHQGSSAEVLALAVGEGTAAVSGGPAPLHEVDPLGAPARRGWTAFRTAGDAGSGHEMSRRDWMSCASCHRDGFAAGHDHLAAALTGADGRVVGHVDPGSLLAASDRVPDLVRLVQQGQGGLHGVDPDAAPPEARAVLEDLDAFLHLAGELPAGLSWPATADGSPVEPRDFPAARACGACHRVQAAAWEGSSHRFADADPFFLAAEDRAITELGPRAATWCRGCHSPLGVLAGISDPSEVVPGRGELEGVACAVCHGAVDLRGAGGNGDLLLDGRVFGTPAADRGHAADLAPPLLATPDFCGACHQLEEPLTGREVDGTFSDWRAWSEGAGDAAAPCQDCHMGPDGHAFPGGNLELSRGSPARGRHRRAVERLWTGAVEIDLHAPASATAGGLLTLEIGVTNVGAGHAIPGAVADLREIWLAVDVVDAAGDLLLRIGGIGEGGALDPDAPAFRRLLADASADPILDHAVWREDAVLEDTRLRPLERQVREFGLVVPSGASGPLTVRAALRFRTFRQDYYDAVLGPGGPVQDVMEIAVAESAIAVAGPG